MTLPQVSCFALTSLPEQFDMPKGIVKENKQASAKIGCGIET